MNPVGITSGAGTVSLTVLVTLRVWPLLLTVTFFLTVTVCVGLQRFPIPVNSEYGPAGNVTVASSNGTPGIAGSVALVIPVVSLMNVSLCRSTVTPSPCSTNTASGNFCPPLDTKYTGPANGTDNSSS